MVKMRDLAEFFETLAPKHLAEDYDNVGLLVEGETDSVTKVLITLDCDESVVKQAKEQGAQLIVSHHPLIFKPVGTLTEQTGNERTIRRLIQEGIGLYAMHTNFDSAEDGLCDVFLNYFGAFSSRKSFTGEAAGIGRIGELQEPCTVKELMQRAKKHLGEVSLSYVGDSQKIVKTVAVCNGGGGDLVYDAKALGADVYISGDFKHHHARFAVENDLPLIAVSHFDAEIGFCRLVEAQLKAAFGNDLEIACSEEENPWKVF